MNQINRKFKSSVFTHLFREYGKEYELYNAIAPGRFPPDTPVKDVTLSNVLYMDRINDLSFVLGDKLVVFFEHQSTINKNMPLRDLIYCGRVYEKLVSSKAIYSSSRFTIPTPEFYVLYNGVSDYPENVVYRLSDMFALPSEIPALELVVHVYNVNDGYNTDIVNRSEALYGYVTLVSKVRNNESSGMTLFDAVSTAIKDCIKQGILVDYLMKYGSEVSNMLIQEWDWDVAKQVWQSEAATEAAKKAKAEGIAEGIAKGEKRGRAEERKKMKATIAKKDAEIADKDAEIAKLKIQLGIKH